MTPKRAACDVSRLKCNNVRRLMVQQRKRMKDRNDKASRRDGPKPIDNDIQFICEHESYTLYPHFFSREHCTHKIVARIRERKVHLSPSSSSLWGSGGATCVSSRIRFIIISLKYLPGVLERPQRLLEVSYPQRNHTLIDFTTTQPHLNHYIISWPCVKLFKIIFI